MLAPLLAVLGVLRAVLSLLAALAHAATVELVISSSVQYSTVQYSTVQYSTVRYSRLLAGVGAPRPHPGPHPLVAGDAVARPAGTRAGVLGVVLDTVQVKLIYRRKNIRKSRLLGSAVND